MANKIVTNISWAIVALLSSSATTAATYYVDAKNGKDSNTGISHKQAWKTVTKVNAAVNSPGSDVYFLAGNVWHEPLIIDWGGTRNDRALIGSYYLKGNLPVIGTISGMEYPTFQGTCVSKKDCPHHTKTSIPSGKWAPMINMKGNYITVQHIKVKNSSGVGISVFGTSAGKQKHNNNYILNNIVDHTLNNGILLNRTSHTNVIRGNIITRAAVIFPYKFHDNWPAALGLANSDNNIIENNKIYNTFGEGIGAFSKSDNNIIRSNLVIKGVKAGIYISCSKGNIIEKNKTLGDKRASFKRIKNGYPATSAYAAASETYCKSDTINNIFRNNLAANVGSCFTSGIQAGAAKADYKTHNSYYNNTCISAHKGFKVNSKYGKNSATMVAKYNLVTETILTCDIKNSHASIFDYNQYDTKPTTKDCTSTNDVYEKPNTIATTDWGEIGSHYVPDNKYFKLTSNSTTADTGTPLTQKILTYSDYPQYKLLAGEISGKCKFDLTINSNDYNCKTRNIKKPDIGAFSK